MRRIFQITKRVFLWALLFIFLYQLWVLANVLWWKWNPPLNTSFMSIRLDELQEKNTDAKLQYEWVDYAKISPHLKRAVIAAEDGKFLEHHGFDWDGMEKAMEKNQRRGKRAAGGSTITQQLAKNLFLSPSKSYIRKAQEAVITLMIEICWDKRRILEVYLNVVEWGDGTFGAQAAAKRHYQSNAAHLSAHQAARMAVMLPNPRKFERNLPAYAIRYSKQVLHRMPMTKIP
jgi:monofunctional biosynthetic peptidoglycan transglycosylase